MPMSRKEAESFKELWFQENLADSVAFNCRKKKDEMRLTLTSESKGNTPVPSNTATCHRWHRGDTPPNCDIKFYFLPRIYNCPSDLDPRERDF